MKLAVIADTHIPRRARDLPGSAYAMLRTVDVILHAGDVLSADFIQSLEAFAPVFAVKGNNDDIELPLRCDIEFGGIKIGMIHDSGEKNGRQRRLRKWFPQAHVVVFGHSHIPFNKECDGLLLFNPGSPTDKRRQEHPTMGLLHISSGAVTGEIILL